MRPRMPTRRAHRTNRQIRQLQIWLLSKQRRTLPRPIHLPAAQHPVRPLRRQRMQHRRTLRRRMRAAPTPRRQASLTTIPALKTSPWLTHPNRRRRCPSMTSLRPPATIICGRPATGPGLHPATTGCPACGSRLPMRALYGRPATGASGITATDFTVDTGVSISASTAASTTALAISASATRAATGVAATSTTTAQSTM